jgi:hypothetical protein
MLPPNATNDINKRVETLAVTTPIINIKVQMMYANLFPKAREDSSESE